MINCSEFASRLNDQLDQRLPPEADAQLVEHASRCDGCRRQLLVWQRISEVMPARSPARHFSLKFGVGLAAAVALAVVFQVNRTSQQPNDDGIVAGRFAAGVSESQANQAAEPDEPSQWWQQVRHRDWVAQTMPAVRRVREGVAPLGRSLLQAVTILTIGGGDHTT